MDTHQVERRINSWYDRGYEAGFLAGRAHERGEAVRVPVMRPVIEVDYDLSQRFGLEEGTNARVIRDHLGHITAAVPDFGPNLGAT